MISVLLPTRGRPERLKATVDNLLETAGKPDDLEIVIRGDIDDESLTNVEFDSVKQVNGIIGERFGYGRMHDYYNELAATSKGDYLLIWNDDTDMKTPGWDVMLTGVPDADLAVQFIKRDILSTADDTFPLVPRWVYEAMGHMSQHCYVDTWLSCVSAIVGLRRFRNDVVFTHYRIPDETSAGRERAVMLEHGRFGALGPQQAADAAKVREALERQIGQRSKKETR